MLDQVLRHFLPRTHPLTLASDPDVLLADEQIRAALAERGFRVIEQPDPIRLRYAVQQARPWTVERPVVVVTPEPLDRLPYDLWQQGHHVVLALHTFFPQLDYQVVRLLSPAQRRRLSAAQASAEPLVDQLSPDATRRYLLQHVFGIAPSPYLRPAEMIAWLDDYHDSADPMPVELQRVLVGELKRISAFRDWPLDEIIASGEDYRAWVRAAWSGAVQSAVHEAGTHYRPIAGLAFEADSALQEIVPRLLRSGTLQPMEAGAWPSLPAWARPALATNDEQEGLRQFSDGLTVLDQQLKDGRRLWKDWQQSARLWARLCVLRWDLRLRHPFEELWRFKALQHPLDSAFQDWLTAQYAPLAGISLPAPHHLYHVPSYLAQQWKDNSGQRQALLIMDGMSLADWLVVREVWEGRHATWQYEEGLVLAQAPSITAVSRQALVSGRRPSQFADTLLHNRNESAAWKAFWHEHGLPRGAAEYVHLGSGGGEAAADVVGSRRVQALALVTTVVDDMVHGATQGAAEVHSSLRIWLHGDDVDQPRAALIEDVLEQLLDHGFRVTLTSDHGHVAAEGMGQPQEGAVAVSRGKRARLYGSAELASLAHAQFPDTVIWHDDGLLPASYWVVMPRGRRAFAPAKQTVVGHGGLTIEEMVVPLITISR